MALVDINAKDAGTGLTPYGLSRRWFLKASLGAGGAVVISATAGPALAASGAYQPKTPSAVYANEPLAWIVFNPDNTVIIRYAKAEMGQGISTALPQILAEELDVDWSSVRVEPAPLGDAFNDPRQKERDTGGSRSVRMSYTLLRTIGAAAKEMLVTAAAKRLGVPVSELVAREGVVGHPDSNRSFSYGELAPDLVDIAVPEDPALKDPSEFRLIGRSLDRLDIPGKTNGSTIFTADVRLPDMLTATVAQCPVFGGRVEHVDDAAAREIPGVVDVHVFDNWVGVVATDYWSAKTGLDALVIDWDDNGNGEVSSATISEHLKTQLHTSERIVVKDDGDVEAGLASSVARRDAVYEVPFLGQVPMEPLGAVAQVTPGKCELWVGTQRPTVTQNFCADLLGIGRDQVILHDLMIGGAFGRRFEFDFVEHAVELARRSNGRPVKVLWTREEEIQHAFYRPATYNEFSGGVDADGRSISAWRHNIAAPALVARLRPYAMRGDLDVTAVEGAENIPYPVPNLHVDYARADTSVPVGPWRSVGSSQNAYVTECFVDELAEAAGRDPYTFRRELLAAAPEGLRHLRVLDAAAEAAGWGHALPDNVGRGIAVAFSFGGWCAQVADVEMGDDGRIKVQRIVAAIDCGTVVNPRIVRTQMESAIIYGLSAALHGEVTIEGGRVVQSNFHDHPILRMDEAPSIETIIIESTEPPGGVGEVGTPPTAPAVVNAVFAVTGERIRSLPLSRHGLV